MAWTKGQLARKAFERIGYASYFADIEPEELVTALVALENMISAWQGQGIRLGWSFEDDPDNIDPDQVVTINDSSRETVIASLAVRIAPIFGKSVSSEVQLTASNGYNAMLTNVIRVPSMRLPNTTPVGQGNKPWRNTQDPFIRERHRFNDIED